MTIRCLTSSARYEIIEMNFHDRERAMREKMIVKAPLNQVRLVSLVTEGEKETSGKSRGEEAEAQSLH